MTLSIMCPAEMHTRTDTQNSYLRLNSGVKSCNSFYEPSKQNLNQLHAKK